VIGQEAEELTGDKATQETNYALKTVSFVALLSSFAVQKHKADDDAHSRSRLTMCGVKCCRIKPTLQGQ
jgi:hypothetical protein